MSDQGGGIAGRGRIRDQRDQQISSERESDHPARNGCIAPYFQKILQIRAEGFSLAYTKFQLEAFFQ